MIAASQACLSPNFGPRRDAALPDMVVLHYTAMESAQEAVDRLCDPQFEVSAHYVIGENGHIWWLVPEEMRAWHAGAGAWGTIRDVNSRSIGIEIANRGDCPFPEPQMAAVEHLLRDILNRWAIPRERVVGHSDTAIVRKIDPGARFDWRRLARSGLSVWPEGGDGAGDFLRDAGRFGYDCENNRAEDVLHAFRLRFRPWASGPLEQEDRRLMHSLAKRWPVRAEPRS